MKKLSKFDAADYLDSEETIAEYLTAALCLLDEKIILHALCAKL